MSYSLGVDLGTTFTAAATFDGTAATMVGLGNRAMQIPSVLHIRPGERVLVGEAAERRGLTDPSYVVREFKRRFGDPIPILVAGSPYSAEQLTAELLTWVLAKTTETRGEPPTEVVLAHPANWSTFKIDLLDQVVAFAGLEHVMLRTEPEAAALQYASKKQLAAGDTIAVYDLGGGTFDICFLARTETGFRILGRPEGIEHLGGVDFDDAMFYWALRTGGIDIGQFDSNNPAEMARLRQLRRECVDAKEALSYDVESEIQLGLPGAQSVRMTRREFEGLIRPSLQKTIDAVQRGMSTAGLSPPDLTAFLLVGGSSRIPLVGELLSEAFGRPIFRDVHPKHDVALGAALAGASQIAPAPLPDAGATPPAAAAVPPPPRPPDAASSSPAVPDPRQPADAVDEPPAATSPGRRWRSWLVVGAVAVIAGAGWFVATRINATSSNPNSGASAAASSSSAVDLSPAPDQSPLATVELPGTTHWAMTTVTLKEGDIVRFSATGTIADDLNRPNQTYDADGAQRDKKNDVHARDPYPLFNHAALLGRLGEDGDPFYIGRSLRINGSAAGRLWLGINDRTVTDNSGSFTVSIYVGG